MHAGARRRQIGGGALGKRRSLCIYTLPTQNSDLRGPKWPEMTQNPPQTASQRRKELKMPKGKGYPMPKSPKKPGNPHKSYGKGKKGK